MEDVQIIEAVLFSAGHPLSMEELVEATELKEKVIKDCIKKLTKEYKSRNTVLEVAQVGTKYAMQLKPEYGANVQKLAVMDIPLRVLKLIKQVLRDIFPLTIIENNVRMVYGGSVNTDNIDGFSKVKMLDGYLVGGASLDADKFHEIAKTL